jgi:hypothetical protein
VITPPKETGRVLSATSLPPSIRAGVLATVTMDAAMVLAGCCLGSVFASDKIGPEIIGRWAGGLARGRWRCLGGAPGRRSDITAEPRQPGELAIGLAVHYVTGITLAEVYFALLGRAGFRPGPAVAVAQATAYGLSTAVLPLLVMYPSMGYGCCGLRSGDAARLLRIMLLGHAAFGAGLGMWAAILGRRAAAE